MSKKAFIVNLVIGPLLVLPGILMIILRNAMVFSEVDSLLAPIALLGLGSLILMVVGVALVIQDIIRYASNRIEVFKDRVVLRSGVFIKKTQTIERDKLESVAVKTNPFGYGRIIIRGTGNAVFRTVPVDNPEQVAETIRALNRK